MQKGLSQLQRFCGRGPHQTAAMLGLKGPLPMPQGKEGPPSEMHQCLSLPLLAEPLLQ